MFMPGSDIDKHHIWCNFFMLPQKDCRQCADLFARFPIKDGEAEHEAVARYFPDAKVLSR